MQKAYPLGHYLWLANHAGLTFSDYNLTFLQKGTMC